MKTITCIFGATVLVTSCAICFVSIAAITGTGAIINTLARQRSER